MQPHVESRQSLMAQQKQLREGYRRVQMFPKGHPELPLPKGYKRTKTKNGDVFHHHPSVSSREIQVASNHGNENHLLDLGPVNKHEAVRRVMAGEHPAAVVERDPHGAKVRGAAGTHVTAPYQLAAMERTKSPGHTVGYEDPDPEAAQHKLFAEGGFVPMAEGGDPGDLPAEPWDAAPAAAPPEPFHEKVAAPAASAPPEPWEKATEASPVANMAGQAQGPGVAPDNAPAEPAAKAATSLQHTDTGEPFYGPMPGMMDALGAGMKKGVSDVSQSYATMSSSNPAATLPATQEEQNPAAAPFEWNDLSQWYDRGLPKVAYRLGESSPALGAGIAGGVAGAGVGTLAGGPPGGVMGGLAGGALGSAAGAAMQAIGPTFAQELRNNPGDPDGAWDAAMKQAAISGTFSGLSWAAFPARFFQGPVKQLAFQAFGVQPAIGTAQKVTENLSQGKPYDEGVGQAVAGSIAGTAVPALGHFALTKPERSTAASPDIVQRNPVSDAFVRNMMPEMASEKSLQADPVAAKYKAKTQQQKDELIHETDADLKKWENIPEQDQRQFINDIQTGQPTNPALQSSHSNIDVQGTANVLRQRLENAYYMEKAYGSPAAYTEDYLPQQYENPNGVRQFSADWFQKTRTFPTYEDAINAGFKPLTTNPIALVNHRLLSGIDMRQRVEFLQDLQQRDMAMPVDPQNPPPQDWQQVKAPNQEQWAISPAAQPLWDRAVKDVSLWSRPDVAGNLFRGYSAVKNATIQYKLGLSAFHLLHVTHIQAMDALTRGEEMFGGLGENYQQTMGDRAMAIPKALGQIGGIFMPFKGMRDREAWLVPKSQRTPEQEQTVQTMVEGGFKPQMPEQFKMSNYARIKQEMAKGWSEAKQGNYGTASWEGAKALGNVPMLPLNVLQNVMFERWIPNLKAASYMNEATSFAARRPDLWSDDIQRGVALRAIAKQVDNRFGEMNYDTLFWHRYARDLGIASATSMGWNLGFMREHVGAVMDPITKRTMTQTPERQTMRAARNRGLYTANYMLSAAAMMGLMSYSLSGQYPTGYDWVFPRIGGNNPDGTPRRVTNMFYTREVPMLMAHMQQEGVLGGLTDMAMNKAAPVIGTTYHAITNKDYFGRPMYDESAPGYMQALQAGKSILGETFSPITLTSAQRALQLAGKPSTNWDVAQGITHGDPDVMRAVAGFSPAPVYANRTDTETKISHLYGQHVAPKSQPYDDGAKLKQQALRDAYLIAKQSGDPIKTRAAAQELAKAGMKPSSIAQMQPGSMLPYLFSKLPTKDQVDVLYGAPKNEFKKFYARSSQATRADPSIQDRWKHYYGRQ